VAVFHTDCGARGRLMLDRVSKDEIVAAMQTPLFGDTCGPWLGMYGFGEITVLGGRNLFHNYTTSLYVLTRPEA
jgi:small ligand-binding sensory domain FIST